VNKLKEALPFKLRQETFALIANLLRVSST
jgi:hypothetical protein